MNIRKSVPSQNLFRQKLSSLPHLVPLGAKAASVETTRRIARSGPVLPHFAQMLIRVGLEVHKTGRCHQCFVRRPGKSPPHSDILLLDSWAPSIDSFLN